MLRGFKNFLLRGDVVVVAIGLMVALAFSTLIASFTTNLINPLLNRAQGKTSIGLGVQLGQAGNHGTLLNFGAFISAIIYFLVFMTVLYLFIVVPYRYISARRGVTVFADPAPAKTCPLCLSEDIPMAATKCKYCGSDLEAAAEK
jgi:large conductance mechanosensitive channel